MVQLLLLALAALVLVNGLRAMSRGEIVVSGNSKIVGKKARVIGATTAGAGLAMAGFALFGLPLLV